VKKKDVKSLHIVGAHLNFSSTVFALKRVEYLKNLDGHSAKVFSFTNEVTLDSKMSILKRSLLFFRLRNEIKIELENGINLIQLYSFSDLILYIIFSPKASRVAICLNIYNIKMNKILEVILSVFIKRVDHFFVSSRFVTDQLWSMFDVPPSRCTVLAITKYIDKKNLKLIEQQAGTAKKHERVINIGCFVGETAELGLLSKLKSLLRLHFSDGTNIRFYLIKNEVNEEFIPEENAFSGIHTLVFEGEVDHLNLDFWLVLNTENPCPYINDALKSGAIIIAPLTNFTSELKRVLSNRLFTYKASEVSSVARMVKGHADNLISNSYSRSGLSKSSWEVERKYLVDGYLKAIRRRSNLQRIL